MVNLDINDHEILVSDVKSPVAEGKDRISNLLKLIYSKTNRLQVKFLNYVIAKRYLISLIYLLRTKLPVPSSMELALD